MKERVQRGGARGARRRKSRSRPTPKWLVRSQELDEIARSRCLMVLSVLSGEKPVSDAVVAAKISRGTYYQMETRALQAMLAALNPLASSSTATGAADLSAAASRIEDLEAKVERLEQEKRRAERLLLLTRKSIRPAPVVTGRRGRPPRSWHPNSTPSGSGRSPASRAKATTTASSTPTKDGESSP